MSPPSASNNPNSGDLAPVHLGLDIGSTTLKLIVLEKSKNGTYEVLFEHYDRHKFDVHGAIETAFLSAKSVLVDRMVTATITGSAGIQLADQMQLPHVQEVVACASAVSEFLTKDGAVDVAVELGGEDTKIIYFGEDGGVREARMNSTCAAGTGSFLDQMAALLGTDTSGLNDLASQASDTRYPIASRCGVFAKSDIQPLLAEGVAKTDIAASVFQAVVTQTVAGLACGRPIKPSQKGRRVAFLGGPLHFLSFLRSTFVETLKLTDEDTVSPPFAHQMVCRGAAIHGVSQVPMPFAFVERRFGLIRSETVVHHASDQTSIDSERLLPLFDTEQDLIAFRERHAKARVERAESSTGPLFLGIDSGSTTTKMVVIDEQSRLIASTYACHLGDTLGGAIKAIVELHDGGIDMDGIKHCYVTGYGEGLLTTALHADGGVVETIAHLTAARHFQPKSDFVIDIGGQDMKAMRIDDTTGVISDVYLNEACSSGCGTFIQTLADSLHLSLAEFAERGLAGRSPLDLGTRCTVFMGSRIKQAQKDGATVEDISAGLAVSVVKNALFKVMRLRTGDDAGKHIVVQGGTFLNDAVLRGLEVTLGREVIRPDIAGHMGAFGAALIAMGNWKKDMESSLLDVNELRQLEWDTSNRRCGKCTNNCQLTVHEFSNGDVAVLGNRCERGAGATERKNASIPDLWTWQKELTFKYTPLPTSKATRGKIGIPRVLEMYDDFPFWATTLAELGYRVVLSKESSDEMFNLGMDSIPDEAVCTPVKLVHGHIASLSSSCPMIFYPGVQINLSEPTQTETHFNCSLMSAYPEVIKNNMVLDDCTLLTPQLPFNEPTRMPEQLCKCLQAVDDSVALEEVQRAVDAGYKALEAHRKTIREKGDAVLEYMAKNNTPAVVLCGRPYHMDPLLSSAIPHMVTAAGYCVLTAESVAHRGVDIDPALIGKNLFVYDSRAIAAAKFISTRTDIGMIQLISFGCSISPNTDDEAKSIIHRVNGAYCVIKIDQNTSVGAVRVRVRSLVAAMNERRGNSVDSSPCSCDYTGNLTLNELVRRVPKAPHQILVFPFSEAHMTLWLTAFNSVGHKAVFAEATSREINEAGMKYCNPDQCYGVTLTAGRFIHGFTSGQFDPNHTDIAWMHTGGVCTAASMAWAIKTSLVSAGFPQVNVHTIDFSGSVDPGVDLSQNLRINMAMTMSDVLEKCLLRTRPYEAVKGSANELYAGFMREMVPFIDHGSFFKFKSKIARIVHEFDTLPLTTEERNKPRVGFVGLMVRHCPEMWEWVVEYVEEEQRCELVMHDMGDFAVAPALNNQISYKIGRDTNKGRYFGTFVHKFFVNLFRDPAMHILAKSKRFDAWPSINRMYDMCTPFLSPGSHPSGESWLPLGEALHMIDCGVNNIVFTVPFQCLPAHIGGRGMFRKMRELYPSSNICCIEFDSTTTALNQFNRIKLLLESMEERKHGLTDTVDITCSLEDIEEIGATQCASCALVSTCSARNPEQAVGLDEAVKLEICDDNVMRKSGWRRLVCTK